MPEARALGSVFRRWLKAARTMANRSFSSCTEAGGAGRRFSEITVEVDKLHTRRAYLAVDGNSVIDLASGDQVVIRRSESYTCMADLGLRNFYDIAFEKLR